MTKSTIAPTAALLADAFPESHIARQEYLDWLYVQSPFGLAIEANLDDKWGRIGHYALVPISLACDGINYPGALSLNTAVHERARGSGVFVRLASQAIAEAGRRGIETVVGVANANSTPGFLRHLKFNLLAPLPANVMVPTPGSRKGIHSWWAGSETASPGPPANRPPELMVAPALGQARQWTPETLRWRLSRPGSRYALHGRGDLLAVSCVQQRYGVRIAILLKVFARASVSVDSRRALVRAVCRFHRAPLALHVGLNDLVDFSGVALPKRLRDSPLNLIYRSLDEHERPAPIVRFEFLDFDAY